jgi:hypothetical protein
MILCKQLYLNKDRSIVMLTSSIRLFHVFMYNSSRMLFKLLIDSLLLLYITLVGFLALNMELSGTTRQVPSLLSDYFVSFVNSRKIDWHTFRIHRAC